ncbi:hypothetical protein ACFQ1S_12405 [Kibdelosporangium lantanae]|uniref:Helix-turn-helix domain-containing protein n=1 Tax=Kibdelosporangium lantanae TaxID=1497396 RepID=A0ABW3M6G3_9PSEU
MNAASMIQMACASTDPIKRAQILAEAQPQLAWALRSAVEECQDANLPWTQIGDRIGLPRETVYRQINSGGPVVTVRASQGKVAPNPASRAAAVDAIYAFQPEDDRWFGSRDAFSTGEFVTAMLPFQPANPETNRFAGQVLRVRIGRCDQDVSFTSAQVRLADGTERRVRVTNEVVNLLLGDGQTPLRQALTQVVHAAVGNPAVDGAFQQVAYRAALAQVESVPAAGKNRIPVAEFVAAVEAVLDEARNFPDGLDAHSAEAVWRLEQVVADYEMWRKATR